MKFLPLVAFTAVPLTTALPLDTPKHADLDERNLGVGGANDIIDALGPVMTSLKALDTAINGLTSDPGTAPPILTASNDANSALNEASGKIQAADKVGIAGALKLQSTGTDLGDMVTKVIDDLCAKKPILDKFGVSQVAADNLTKQKANSGALTDALVSKIPKIAQPLAKQSTDKIDTAINNGIKTLSSGSGGTGTSPAAPPPATTGGAGTTGGAVRSVQGLGLPPLPPLPPVPALPNILAPLAPKPGAPDSPAPPSIEVSPSIVIPAPPAKGDA